jgi:hypothetical protein
LLAENTLPTSNSLHSKTKFELKKVERAIVTLSLASKSVCKQVREREREKERLTTGDDVVFILVPCFEGMFTSFVELHGTQLVDSFRNSSRFVHVLGSLGTQFGQVLRTAGFWFQFQFQFQSVKNWDFIFILIFFWEDDPSRPKTKNCSKFILFFLLILFYW